MERLNRAEMKEVQMKILKTVANYCDENDLIYFLGYGTLLGAVRHQGYIPWDDDIDIMMPRSDYEIFIEKFKLADYDVNSHYKDEDYPYLFAKVSYEKSRLFEKTDLKYDIGINIDVFPLDEFTESIKFNIKYCQIKFYQKLLTIKTVSLDSNRELYKNIALKVGKFILKPFNYRKIIYKINEKAKSKGSTADSKLRGCIVGTRGMTEIMDESIFTRRMKLTFEGSTFYVPGRYKEFLNSVYGDYMELPPIEERITHHNFKAYKL